MWTSGALHQPGCSDLLGHLQRSGNLQNLHSRPALHFQRPTQCRRSVLSPNRDLVCRVAAPVVGIDFPGLRFGKVGHDRIQVAEGPLQEIRRPDVNIVLQHREPPVPEAELQQLLSRHGAPARSQAVFDVDEPGGSLESLCSFIPEGKLRDHLIADIGQLSLQFCNMLGISRVTLTLSLLRSSPAGKGRLCPRWHSDYVTVRGLCTYMGLGTEFVRNEDADRRLWERALGADTGGYRLKREDRILAANPGDILYLKGHAYPDNEGCGAVHRSPEAETPRLLLVMDDVDSDDSCACCTPTEAP